MVYPGALDQSNCGIYRLLWAFTVYTRVKAICDISAAPYLVENGGFEVFVYNKGLPGPLLQLLAGVDPDGFLRGLDLMI